MDNRKQLAGILRSRSTTAREYNGYNDRARATPQIIDHELDAPDTPVSLGLHVQQQYARISTNVRRIAPIVADAIIDTLYS